VRRGSGIIGSNRGESLRRAHGSQCELAEYGDDFLRCVVLRSGTQRTRKVRAQADASTPPALRIKSSDTVEIQTLITSSPNGSKAREFLPTKSSSACAISMIK
jgi:hypothetical protein